MQIMQTKHALILNAKHASDVFRNHSYKKRACIKEQRDRLGLKEEHFQNLFFFPKKKLFFFGQKTFPKNNLRNFFQHSPKNIYEKTF